MYMDALESEVESLSAELTRLRIMLHRVTQVMEAPPPPPSATPVPAPVAAVPQCSAVDEVQQLLSLLQNSKSLDLLRSLLNVENNPKGECNNNNHYPSPSNRDQAGEASIPANVTIVGGTAAPFADRQDTRLRAGFNSFRDRTEESPFARRASHMPNRRNTQCPPPDLESEHNSGRTDASDEETATDKRSNITKGTEATSESPVPTHRETTTPSAASPAAVIDELFDRRHSLDSQSRSDQKLSVVERLQNMGKRHSNEDDSSLLLTVGRTDGGVPLERLANFKSRSELPSMAEYDKKGKSAVSEIKAADYSTASKAPDYSFARYSFSMINDSPSQGNETSQSPQRDSDSSEDDELGTGGVPVLGARRSMSAAQSPHASPSKSMVSVGNRTKASRLSVLERLQQQQQDSSSESTDEESTGSEEEEEEEEEGGEEEANSSDHVETSSSTETSAVSAAVASPSPKAKSATPVDPSLRPVSDNVTDMISQTYGDGAYSWGWQTPQLSPHASAQASPGYVGLSTSEKHSSPMHNMDYDMGLDVSRSASKNDGGYYSF